MSSFTQLMQLSAQRTAEQSKAVSSAMAERERALEAKRKAQEERERKQRLEDAALRQKRFEDERKAAEIERKKAAEAAARERDLEAHKEAQMRALLGNKRRSVASSRDHSSSPGPSRKRRERSDSPDAMNMLTREEKRARKEDLERRRAAGLLPSKKGPSHRSSNAHLAAGRRLPGGAIDAEATDTVGSAAGGVKARLAALPPTLMKLNLVKRDLRTIDEIVTDNARRREAKVLDGEEAKEFSDWFGKKKDKEKAAVAPSPTPRPSQPASPAPTPAPAVSAAAKRKLDQPRASSSQPSRPSKDKAAKPKTTSHSQPLPKRSVPAASSSASGKSKLSRRRSPSSSPSPPPRQRSKSHPRDDISSQIWSLFGKNRDAYVARDVESDEDEDMEADADDVMREEARSALAAKREDQIAMEEERRHEAEKRRRKAERERGQRA